MASDRGCGGHGRLSRRAAARVVQTIPQASPSPLALSRRDRAPRRTASRSACSTSAPRSQARDAGDVGRSTRARSRARKPRRAASASRRSSLRRPGAPRRRGRPRRPPPCRAATGASLARARDRERDREVGARLGDAHAARDARVDVVRRPSVTPACCSSTASSIASRPPSRPCADATRHRRRRAHRPAPAPRRAAAARPRAPPRPPSPDAPARRSARNSARRVGHVGQPVARSSRTDPSSSVEPKRCLSARSMRSAWWRSPSNESTVSTTCSSTRGPASAPSLVTWPDEHRRDAALLGVLHEPVRAVAHLARPTRARRAASGSSDGLDRVDREHVGRDRRRRARGRAGSDVSAHDEQVRGERAEPLGAQPHLRGRLLGARRAGSACPGRGHAPERLEQQRALADARLAAEQRDRARRRGRRRAPGRARARPVGRRRGAGRRRRRSAPGRRRATRAASAPAAPGPPPRPACPTRRTRAAPEPRGDSHPHSEQRWTVLATSSSSWHRRTVRPGCDTRRLRDPDSVTFGARRWWWGSIST